jgi:hypothetical protein
MVIFHSYVSLPEGNPYQSQYKVLFMNINHHERQLVTTHEGKMAKISLPFGVQHTHPIINGS